MMRLNRLLLLLLSLFMVVVHCSEDAEKEKADFLSHFNVKFNDDVHTITFTRDDDAATAPDIQIPRGELTGLSPDKKDETLSFTVDIPLGELTKPDFGPEIPHPKKKWLPSLYTSVRELPVRVLSPPLEVREFTSSPITYEWKGTVGEAFDGPMKEFPLAIELVSNSAIRELCAGNGAVHISGMDWNPDPNFPLEMVLDVEREQEKHGEIYKHCHAVSNATRGVTPPLYQALRHALMDIGVDVGVDDEHDIIETKSRTWWVRPYVKGDPILFYDPKVPFVDSRDERVRILQQRSRFQIARLKAEIERDDAIKRYEEAQNQIALTIDQLKHEIELHSAETKDIEKELSQLKEGDDAPVPQSIVSKVKQHVQNTNGLFERTKELLLNQNNNAT
jgi:hypothetical protein